MVLPALQCCDIRANYGDVTALTEIGISFEAGLIHAVVAQNGAGKTTFFRVAAGLVRPNIGTLSINGRQLRFGDVAEKSNLPQLLEVELMSGANEWS